MGLKLNTSDVIKHCAYETQFNGYVKRSADEDVYCTADKVFDAITKAEVSEDELASVKDRVSKWLEYVDNSSGEYFENIKSEITKPKLDETKIGLIASSFSAFDKYNLHNKLLNDEKSSEFLGEEGDNITINVKDYKLIKSGVSKFKTGSSKWFLYKIYDNFGNVIMWFSDHDSEFEFKHSKKITAAISKLTEYNGVKQTTITKLKWLDD